MRDALVRAVLVVGGVNAAAVWTWPGPFPDTDPVAVLVRVHTPIAYRVVVAWYYLAPGLAVWLVGQFLVSTARIWFARMGLSLGRRSSLPAWPLSPTDHAPAIVIGEVHHPVHAVETSTPDWLTIPERGLYTGVAIFGAVGSGKTSARSAKASKTLDTMRARIVKADEARAAQVAEAANRDAAAAWDALATHAATHAAQCRHGADLAERTRRRWAH